MSEEYELVASIGSSINSLQKQVKAVLPLISDEINGIVNQKIDDPKKIESILDQLLDFSMLGLGLEQFEKLNQYYSSINSDTQLLALIHMFNSLGAIHWL